MAFGQSPGPTASPRQVQRLLDLLRAAGHRDFRDARGPMGFTQRQANGRFTRDEATALIEQLEQEAADNDGDGDRDHAATELGPARGTPARRTAMDRALERAPAAALAAELQKRGWIVVEP
jgi:hypothetical protein